MQTKKRILITTFSVLVAMLMMAGNAYAVTTIDSNIDTDGTLTVTGTSSLVGNTSLTGTLTVGGISTLSGAVTATAGITSGSDVVSDTDSTDDLGTTAVRWANVFADGLTGNTIALDGATGINEIQLVTNLADAFSIEDTAGDLMVFDTTTGTQVLTITPATTVTGGITSGSDVVSDTDSTDDLGTTAVRWANVFADGLTGSTIALDGLTGANTLTITDAVADGLSIIRGTTDVIVFDTATPRVTITPATTITGAITATGGVLGALDGVVGGNTPAAGTFTTLSATGTTLALDSDGTANTMSIVSVAGTGTFLGSLTMADISAARTWTLPNTTGNLVVIEGGLAVAAGKTLTASNTLTLAGTDGQTMTFPAASDTMAGLGTAQTFTVNQTIEYGHLFLGDSDDGQTLQILVNENMTGDKTLTYQPNDGNRTISLEGDITLTGDLITVGDDSLTFTTGGATDVTLPTTGTLATLAGAETLSNKTLTAPKIVTTDGIADDGGAFYLKFVEDATPVDYIQITSADAAAHPIIEATGATANIDLLLDARGTGDVAFQDGTELRFDRATFDALIVVADQSGEDHTFNIPDIATGASDTFVFLAEAQTLTNKTLTSPDINGGTWNGTIDDAWTAAGQTCADLGTVTTADIDGGNIDGVTIGAAAAPTVTDLGSVATCDINGGTIGGITIDGAWTAAGQTCADLGTVTTIDIDGGTITGITDLAVADGGTGASTLNDLITLTTHTTGNYTASIADAGNTTITVVNGAAEGGAVTLDAINVNCASCLDHDELAATITFADADLVDFGSNVTDATEGLMIPAHATDCSVATAEGQICWQEDTQLLYVGNGTAAVGIAGSTGAANTWTGTNEFQANVTYTFADAEKIDINSTLAAAATTVNILELDLDSQSTGTVNGLYISIDATGNAAALYGLNIANLADSDQAVDGLIYLDNADAVATDGIIIAASGGANMIADAIDASAANITNAINVGANVIIGTGGATINFDNFDVDANGNITVAAAEGLDTNGGGALEIGYTNATSILYGGGGAITAHTFATDGTGDSEIVLPNDSIGTAEILDDTIVSANMNETLLKYATVAVSNAEIKALNAAPKELVAAPGAGKVIEFVSAVIILDYGSEVLTEAGDNFVIEYNTGAAVACSEVIETTGFIDQAADTITNAIPVKDVIDAAADIVNKNIALYNLGAGAGEIAGNVTADSTLIVKVVYRVHTTGL